MKSDRKSLLEFYNGIVNILNSDQEYDYEFNRSLIKTKKEIKPECEETIEMLKNIEKQKNQLRVKFCSKDKDGKPVTEQIRPGVVSYFGLDNNEEFTSEIIKLTQNEQEYLSEEVEFVGCPIAKNSIPKKLRGSFQETIDELVHE